MVALASADSRDTAVDVNAFPYVHGHTNKCTSNETEKLLGADIQGKLKPYTGCSMWKGYRQPIATGTKPRASDTLGRAFVDLSDRRVWVRRQASGMWR